MRIKNERLIRKAESFFLNLKKEDRIAILHHTDPDGITSGVIINKIIKKVIGKEVSLKINQKPDEIFITKETLKLLKKNRVNKFIVTDLSIDQYKDNILKEVTKFAEIFILDHHKLYRDLNSDKITHVKPQLVFKKVDPSAYCAAKFALDLGSRIVKVDELDWIAAIGMIGDQVINKWKTFKKKVFSRYKIKDKKNIFDTSIGKVTETIFFTEAYDTKKIGECFERINSAKNFKTVLDSKLKDYRKKVENEINYWKNNVLKFAEFYPKQELIFDYIKPRYAIKSAISSVISNKYPNKTIIIAQDMKNDFIQLSVRRMDKKIAVNELLEKVLKNFHSANGGGHINSAGGRIRKEDLYKFKNSILDMMENRVIFR